MPQTEWITERSHKRGMEHLRCHNYESTEPSTDEMETSDKCSESEPEDTDLAHQPGTWEGKKRKVSLPELNEKSTTNDAVVGILVYSNISIFLVYSDKLWLCRWFTSRPVLAHDRLLALRAMIGAN